MFANESFPLICICPSFSSTIDFFVQTLRRRIIPNVATSVEDRGLSRNFCPKLSFLSFKELIAGIEDVRLFKTNTRSYAGASKRRIIFSKCKESVLNDLRDSDLHATRRTRNNPGLECTRDSLGRDKIRLKLREVPTVSHSLSLSLSLFSPNKILTT